MARFKSDVLGDEAVEQEIERLRNSDAVRLARAEVRERYRRRQYLYQLRCLEKRGMELMANGWTPGSDVYGEEYDYDA